MAKIEVMGERAAHHVISIAAPEGFVIDDAAAFYDHMRSGILERRD